MFVIFSRWQYAGYIPEGAAGGEAPAPVTISVVVIAVMVVAVWRRRTPTTSTI